jgi:hypothetical protein
MMADLHPRVSSPSSNDEDAAEGIDGDLITNGQSRTKVTAPTHFIATSTVQGRPTPDAAIIPNPTPIPSVNVVKSARPVMVFPATQSASLSLSDQVDAEIAAPMQLASLSSRVYAAAAFSAGSAGAVASDAPGESFRVETSPAAQEHAAQSNKLSKREERERAARALASKKEAERQLLARKSRGDAIVQVGAFRSKKDAKAALAQLSKHFPSFAEREISSFKRKDGVWYRARFAGLGTSVARDACSIVSRRGGTCKIIAL